MLEVIHRSVRALALTMLPVALAACGGGDDAPAPLAATSTVTMGAPQAGVSPFISLIDLQGTGLDQLSAVRFMIAAKAGAASRPVDVTYTLEALSRHGRVNGDKVTVPVFGLYAGTTNHVGLTLKFKDASTRELSLDIPTATYTDPNGVYDKPSFVRKREVGSTLGFNYFFLKSRLGSPVVMDTDGEIRWVVPNVASSTSTLFRDDRFVIGGPSSPAFTLLGLDGSVQTVPLATSTLTNFHHNIDPGKTGMLGEFDAKASPTSPTDVESTIADFNASGTVSKIWDFAQIFTEQMTAQGDDAQSFVRQGIDWFHTNAAIYDPSDDSLIVSSRENFVVKVDYASGNVIWILGDPTKYWYTFPSLRAKAIRLQSGDHYPLGQHALSITSDGLLMMFDDGLGSLNQPSGTSAGDGRDYSAVTAYSIDTKTLTGKEAWRFDYDRLLYSDICSSAYEASDKSVLVNYAVAQGRTQVRFVGLDAQHSVVFDIALSNTKNCDVSWNAEPLALDALRIN